MSGSALARDTRTSRKEHHSTDADYLATSNLIPLSDTRFDTRPADFSDWKELMLVTILFRHPAEVCT